MDTFKAGKHAWAQRAFECLIAGTQAGRPGAILQTECEWLREDWRSARESRTRAVNDLIELVQGLDALLILQVPADDRELLASCRRQHIASGFYRRGFTLLLHALLPAEERLRLEAELAPIVQ